MIWHDLYLSLFAKMFGDLRREKKEKKSLRAAANPLQYTP